MMNLNLKDNIGNKSNLLLDKIVKSNGSIIEHLGKNAPAYGNEIKIQIINNSVFIEKMKSLLKYYSKKENVNIDNLKANLPSDNLVKITPLIESILINLADNLVIN